MSRQATRVIGPLPRGKTKIIIDEVVAAAGTTCRDFNIDSDSVLVSLYVESITGTLDVTVKTITDDDKELVAATFPSITASTTSLVIQKAAVVMGRIRIEATYSGACTYEVRAKGIGFGEISTRLLGAEDATASQADITTTPALIISSALTDRAGTVIKNNSISNILYIGYTAGEATAGNGYPLGPGESIGMDISAGQEIYGVASAGTIDVRIMEAGG